MEQDYDIQEGQTRTTRRNLRGERPSSLKSFADQSPDEVKESVKNSISKAVAVVAGVLDGFNETMEESEVADNVKRAIDTLGEATENLVESAREQVLCIRDAFNGQKHAASESMKSGSDSGGSSRLGGKGGDHGKSTGYGTSSSGFTGSDFSGSSGAGMGIKSGGSGTGTTYSGKAFGSTDKSKGI